MRSRDLLLLGLLATAVVLSGAAVRALIDRDRGELITQLGRERSAQLAEAGQRFAEDLDDIADDLRFAAGLLSRGGTIQAHQQELRALLEVVGQYKALGLVGADGKPRLMMIDRKAPPAVRAGALSHAMQQTGLASIALPAGQVATSVPLEADGSELRAFATQAALPPDGSPGAVTVLVDVTPLMAPFRLISSQPDAKLLVLGAHGRPTSASDPRLSRAAAAGVGHGLPHFRAAVERMREGAAACERLPDAEAAELGLEQAEAVMCMVPLEMAAGGRWSAATLFSTRSLAAHERRVVVRVIAGALLVGLFLAVFSAYVVLASRRAAALRESQRHAGRLAHLHDQVRKILDNIPTGVLALSERGTVSAVNRALQQRLGPAPVLQQPLAEAFPGAPAPVQQRLQSLVRRAEAERQVVSLSGEQLALFGSEGRFNVHAVPLEPLDPEVRALLVLEDLSSVSALESQLVRAEKLATVGVLAAGIAHEIGSPLGVVRGRAEFLLGKAERASATASGLKVIIEQIDQVSRTLRQLLDFSRVQPAQARTTAPEPVIRSVVELLRLEAQRRSVRLQARVDGPLPAIWADPDQLQQVLVNLAINAFDACAEGGEVEVSATVDRSAEEWPRLRLTVEDDGCGIPEPLRAQVFDPFFTTKKRGQGTGLGLAIVAQIVRNHGGSVELESAEGQGTRVTVRWPLASGREEGRDAAI
jgi:signal transduction histidine kinase